MGGTGLRGQCQAEGGHRGLPLLPPHPATPSPVPGPPPCPRQPDAVTRGAQLRQAARTSPSCLRMENETSDPLPSTQPRAQGRSRHRARRGLPGARDEQPGHAVRGRSPGQGGARAGHSKDGLRALTRAGHPPGLACGSGPGGGSWLPGPGVGPAARGRAITSRHRLGPALRPALCWARRQPSSGAVTVTFWQKVTPSGFERGPA